METKQLVTFSKLLWDNVLCNVKLCSEELLTIGEAFFPLLVLACKKNIRKRGRKMSLIVACKLGLMGCAKWIMVNTVIKEKNLVKCFPTACKGGKLVLVQGLVEKIKASRSLPLFPATYGDHVDVGLAFGKACARGHVVVAKWMRDHLCMTKDDAKQPTHRTLAKYSLDIMKWVIDTFQFEDEEASKYIETALLFSFMPGKVPMLQWFKERYKFRCMNDIVTMFRCACRTGQLDAAKWYVDNFPKLRLALGIMALEDVTRGGLEITKWYWGHFITPNQTALPISMDLTFMVRACASGELPVVQWVYDNHMRSKPSDTAIIRLICNTCAYKKFDVAKWLWGLASLQARERLMWRQADTELVKNAIENGDVAALEWLCEAMPPATYVLAFLFNTYLGKGNSALMSLSIAKWLHSRVIGVLEYRDSAVSMLISTCCRGDMEYARWLVETLKLKRQYVRMYSDAVFLGTCQNGHLKMAKWLSDTFNLSGASDTFYLGYNSMLAICSNGNMKCWDWLVREFQLVRAGLGMLTRKDTPLVPAEEGKETYWDCCLRILNLRRNAKVMRHLQVTFGNPPLPFKYPLLPVHSLSPKNVS